MKENVRGGEGEVGENSSVIRPFDLNSRNIVKILMGERQLSWSLEAQIICLRHGPRLVHCKHSIIDHPMANNAS